MDDFRMRALDGRIVGADALPPLWRDEIRRLQRRARRRRIVAATAALAWFTVLMLAMIYRGVSRGAVNWGSHWSAAVCVAAECRSAGLAITRRRLPSASVSFRGKVASNANRESVTLVLQRMNYGRPTAGRLLALAGRVFNTAPTPLLGLFTAMDVSAQPGATYRLTVQAKEIVLESVTFTLVA